MDKVSKLGISFSWRSLGIHIYRSTLLALENPSYVRFLVNYDKKQLAVQVCDKKETGSIKVSKATDKTSVVSSVVMLKLIWKLCDWDKKDTVRAYGKLYPKNHIVEFDLNNIEIISENEFAVESI